MWTSKLPLIVQHMFIPPHLESADRETASNSTKVLSTFLSVIEVQTTVLQMFKKDLSLLFQLLNSTSRHYVRCIKPNNQKKPHLFDRHKVLEQLQSNGVLATVKLRKAGYANKFPFLDFFLRYSVLGILPLDSIPPEEVTAESVLLYLEGYSALSGLKWAVGKR